MYDILQRVSRTEASITYLEGHAETASRKLDSISSDLSAAKATFNTLKWIFGGICVAVWGMIALWAKHHFGW
jgi:hypothetical protein